MLITIIEKVVRNVNMGDDDSLTFQLIYDAATFLH